MAARRRAEKREVVKIRLRLSNDCVSSVVHLRPRQGWLDANEASSSHPHLPCSLATPALQADERLEIPYVSYNACHYPHSAVSARGSPHFAVSIHNYWENCLQLALSQVLQQPPQRASCKGRASGI